MSEYEKMLADLEQASSFCVKAEQHLTPISRIKPIDSYVLGLLQCVRLILTDAKKAVRSAARVRNPPPKHI